MLKFILDVSVLKLMGASVCLFDLLTYGGDEYNRLMRSMLCDDFFIMQDRFYDFFREVRVDGELVGFGCGSFIFEGEGVLLELFYLLEDFRGKNYFCDFLNFCIDSYACVVLDRPNHYSVLSLIENGFAEMRSDYLVYVLPLLSFEDYDTGERVCSHFYDLRLSAIVVPSVKKISPLQQVDVECFNAHNGRDKYFTDDYWLLETFNNNEL